MANNLYNQSANNLKAESSSSQPANEVANTKEGWLQFTKKDSLILNKTEAREDQMVMRARRNKFLVHSFICSVISLLSGYNLTAFKVIERLCYKGESVPVSSRGGKQMCEEIIVLMQNL